MSHWCQVLLHWAQKHLRKERARDAERYGYPRSMWGPLKVKRPATLEPMEQRLLLSANLNDPVVNWRFEDGQGSASVMDLSENGHTGILQQGSQSLPSFVSEGRLDQGLRFDESGHEITLDSSVLVNNVNVTQRTISVWFKADDVSISSRKQVIYEEGGTWRGLNIYVHAGRLYMGGWNTQTTNGESGWGGVVY